MGLKVNVLGPPFDFTGSGGGGGGGAINWKDSVADFASLPANGNTAGDTRITLDTTDVYSWTGSAWKLQSSGSLPTFTPNRVIISDNSGNLADNNAANDVTIVSNSLQRGKAASPAVVHEEYLDTIPLMDSVTNQNIAALSFAHGTYAGFTMDYIIKTGASTPDIRIGKLEVVSNGTTISITDNYNETALIGSTFSAVINGANTEIHYTTTFQGSNRTLRGDFKRFRI